MHTSLGADIFAGAAPGTVVTAGQLLGGHGEAERGALSQPQIPLGPHGWQGMERPPSWAVQHPWDHCQGHVLSATSPGLLDELSAFLPIQRPCRGRWLSCGTGAMVHTRALHGDRRCRQGRWGRPARARGPRHLT